MSAFQHTYGVSCRLKPSRPVKPAGSSSEDEAPPPLNVQYFYAGLLPIDDPISPVPNPSSAGQTSNIKLPLRPFVVLDNAELDEAWLDVHRELKRVKKASRVRVKHGKDKARSSTELEPTSSPSRREETGLQPESSERASQTRSPGISPALGPTKSSRPMNIVSEGEQQRPSSPAAGSGSVGPGSESSYAASPKGDKNTTGTPFVRASVRKSRIPSRRAAGLSTQSTEEVPSKNQHSSLADTQSIDAASHQSRPSTADSLPEKEEAELPSNQTTVGLMRLHMVKLPQLQMEPIYWSPINDVSYVTRGTWFYKDSMLPLEANLANQLEHGYQELRVWSETWSDELNSAVQVGAEGEVKVTHRIWPEDDPKKLAAQRKGQADVAATSTEALEQPDESQIPPEDEVDVVARAAQGTLPGKSAQSTSRFPNSHVIYANEREAYILKPSLMPSAYYGRRPVSKIRKGTRVGVAVVRGFDWKAWNWLHPPQESAWAVRADEIASMSRAADPDRRKICRACLAQHQTQKVTDLVLVIHGIGQQLSKRIESYAFTHAINSFRRQILVELGQYGVQTHLRKDMGGIMALPINWRSTLSFEDGGPVPMDDEGNALHNQFNLKDITPETIPAIRSLISDVMLDIPYYLSHHKPKMVEGVIREANRVYRLWCLNNPGFEVNGKVHVIAHSLGSAMALDILSKQPSTLPRELDPLSATINDQFFNFDTKNLFMCGSPAGFFLLLNRATLMPRKGRPKAGVEGEDNSSTGDAGIYGSLAIDNLYNIMSFNDPVAYRLNAAVDKHYASTLKPAVIPSATNTFFGSLGAALKSPFSSSHATPSSPPPPHVLPPGVGPATAPVMGPATPGVSGLPTPQVSRLPANVELETHDFTAEEVAERRMYRLNDNGQLDYFLASNSSNIFEIQYLNMLGAHSSYWISRDFVRFLVLEVGRAHGPGGTLPELRAAKKRR